jgi:hypothetical protein
MAFCTNCGATVTGAFCNQCGTRASTGAASASAGPATPSGQTAAAAGGAASSQAAGAPPYAAPPVGSYAPPVQQPAAAGAYAAPPAPRKTSPLVWILVAIMGLFVLFGIGVFGVGWYVVHKAHQAGLDPDLWRRNPGMAVGKLLAATNPDVDVVRTDDNAGTITLRNRRTGKETTITFDQARQGKITFSTEDDNGKRATVEIGGAGKPPAWVPEYPGSHPTYSIKGSGDAGEEGGNYTFTTDDAASRVMTFYQDKTKQMGMEAKLTTTTADGGMLVAAREGDDRSLTIVVGSSSGQTTVNVTYARKR